MSFAYEILQLSSRLLDNTILTVEHDTHTTEVPNLSSADDQGFDIETPPSQSPGYAGEYTRFILYKAVENMSE
jgi:hypothetical protein